ncbi:MAG: hypothetical protein HY549_06770 [Elusimicrobia bacterium]|nr:hypothetical protein [Elusimicrobiota bacterium]
MKPSPSGGGTQGTAAAGVGRLKNLVGCGTRRRTPPCRRVAGLHVKGHRVLTQGDELIVARRKGVARRHVEGLARYLDERREHVRLGYGQLRDSKVICLYAARDGFGYAINLDDASLSERGYVPIPRTKLPAESI